MVTTSKFYTYPASRLASLLTTCATWPDLMATCWVNWPEFPSYAIVRLKFHYFDVGRKYQIWLMFHIWSSYQRLQFTINQCSHIINIKKVKIFQNLGQIQAIHYSLHESGYSYLNSINKRLCVKYYIKGELIFKMINNSYPKLFFKIVIRENF